MSARLTPTAFVAELPEPEVVDLPPGELREALVLARVALARVALLTLDAAPHAPGRIALQGEAIERSMMALALIAQEKTR